MNTKTFIIAALLILVTTACGDRGIPLQNAGFSSQPTSSGCIDSSSGMAYASGVSWQCDCNRCSCVAGQVQSTQMACAGF